MFPKEHLHLIVRDEGLVPAARALASASEASDYVFDAAAIAAAAAILDPVAYGDKVRKLYWELPEPNGSYEATLSAFVWNTKAYIDTIDSEEDASRFLDAAQKVCEFSRRARWLRALVREVRAAPQRAADPGPLPMPEVLPPEGWQQVQA